MRGTGQIRDTPFRVTAQLLSPDATVNNGENKLTLRAWAANNVIDVAGTLPSLADVENVPLRTRAQGRNLAELLGIIGVVLPNTRDYSLRAQLVKDGEDYRFTHMAGHFGNSDLAGRLTVTNGERAAARFGAGDAQPRYRRCRAVHRLQSRYRCVARRGGRRRGDRCSAATHLARCRAAGRGHAALRRAGSNGRSATSSRATCRSRTST